MVSSSALSVYYVMPVKSAPDKEERWEFCPYCFFGFSNYLGEKKGYHEFECGDSSCEAFFRVEVGKGNFDIRLGSELYEDRIYLQVCDSCRKTRPVKVISLRFLCKKCKESLFK